MSSDPSSSRSRVDTAVPAHRRPVSLEGCEGRELALAERVNRLCEEAEITDRLLSQMRVNLDGTNTLYQSNNRSLAAFRRISRSLGAGCDVPTLAASIVEAIAEELAVEHCSLMLLDGQSGELCLTAGASCHDLMSEPSHPTGTRFKVGQGIAGATAASRRSVRIDDVTKDPRWLETESSVAVRSLLCLPLLAGERLMGVLNLSHPEPGFFTPDHERIFEVFGPIVGQLVAATELQAQLRSLNAGLEQEVRRRTDQVRETQAGLARYEKLAALGETLSGIAHELNNRLMPIVMYADSLADARLPARETKQIRAIADAAAGVKGIVESLLGFSRQRKPRKVAVDLNAVIEGTISVVKYTLQRHGIQIRASFYEALPLTKADPLQIEQVALNLLQNARDAILSSSNPESGVILVTTGLEDDWITIQVRDNGCGIPEQNLSKIMDPFFTTKAPSEGTGLGLALCYGMVSEHGGEIRVASRPGNTTFTLRFPLVEVRREDLASAPGSASARGSELSEDLRVLVIDDDESILSLMHDVLDGRLQVDTASSGLEALQKLESHAYDAVICDMRMPGLGGRDIHRWLLEHRPGLERRMIFATGDTIDPATHDFVAASGAYCLPKPFTVKGILSALTQLLARELTASGSSKPG